MTTIVGCKCGQDHCVCLAPQPTSDVDREERVRKEPLSVATKKVLKALRYESWEKLSTDEGIECIRPLESWDLF